MQRGAYIHRAAFENSDKKENPTTTENIKASPPSKTDMNKQNQWRRPDLHPAAKFFLLQEISLPFSFLQNIPYLNSITTLLLQKNCQIKILLPTLCVVLFSFAFSSMFGFFFLSNFFSCLSNPPTLLAFVSISCP